MRSFHWLAAAIVLLSAGSANASIWLREEFIGTVTSVANPSGFLAPTRVGDRWTAVFYFDPTQATVSTDPSQTEIIGGLMFADVGIGSRGVAIFGSNAATTGAYSFDSYSEARAQTSGIYPAASGFLSTMLSSTVTAPPGVIPPTFAAGSYFVSGSGNYIEGTENIGANIFIVDFSYFNATVPEPATWTMLLVGFGFTGFALRTRKRRQAAAQDSYL